MPKNTHKRAKNHVKKVKIKRVDKTHKKATTREKILAGFGLASTISGLGTGIVRPQAKTSIVSTQSQSSGKDSKTLLQKVFGATLGILTAQAASETLVAANTTSGQTLKLNDLASHNLENVGDGFTLTLTGTPGARVFVDWKKDNGDLQRAYMKDSAGNDLLLDQNGQAIINGTWDGGTLGTWSEDWKLTNPDASESWVGNLSFIVRSANNVDIPPATNAPVILGVQGFDPLTGSYTNAVSAAGKYLILYGNFSGNNDNIVKIDGRVASNIAQSVNQINVLLDSTLSAGQHT